MTHNFSSLFICSKNNQSFASWLDRKIFSWSETVYFIIWREWLTDGGSEFKIPSHEKLCLHVNSQVHVKMIRLKKNWKLSFGYQEKQTCVLGFKWGWDTIYKEVNLPSIDWTKLPQLFLFMSVQKKKKLVRF